MLGCLFSLFCFEIIFALFLSYLARIMRDMLMSDDAETVMMTVGAGATTFIMLEARSLYLCADKM